MTSGLACSKRKLAAIGLTTTYRNVTMFVGIIADLRIFTYNF
jgi:hypothetical protein